MKVLVIGSTHGIGKEFADFFENGRNEVIRISRTNGYHIENDFDTICKLAAESDLVFNNLSYKDYQQKLLYKIYKIVPLVVISGGIVRQYPNIKPDVAHEKNRLYHLTKRIASASPDENFSKVLYLDFTFNENSSSKDRLNHAHTTPLAAIIKIIKTWIESPVFWYVDFNLNIDYHLYSLLCNKDSDLDILWRDIKLLSTWDNN